MGGVAGQGRDPRSGTTIGCERCWSNIPALVSWRDESDQTLLDSTTSYAMDCSEPERERIYTRPVAAEMLIDAGATVERKTWEHVIRTGASGMCVCWPERTYCRERCPYSPRWETIRPFARGLDKHT